MNYEYFSIKCSNGEVEKEINDAVRNGYEFVGIAPSKMGISDDGSGKPDGVYVIGYLLIFRQKIKEEEIPTDSPTGKFNPDDYKDQP